MEYLDDGYTESAYIKPEPPLNGEIRFKFRPMLFDEREAVLDKMEGGIKTKERINLVIAVLEKHLVEWSVVDGKGEPVPLAADRIKKVKPRHLDRMFLVVVGRSQPDPDPTQTETEAESDEEDYATQLMRKQSDDEKNSVGG